MLIFVLIAGCSVSIPVIAHLLASRRMARPLESLRGWLVQNNATVMAVLPLVIGVVVIGKGLGNFGPRRRTTARAVRGADGPADRAGEEPESFTTPTVVTPERPST